MITTKHDLDVSSQVYVIRKTQAVRQTVYVCKPCRRPLSVAEFIERWCEHCRRGVAVEATKEPAV